MRHYYLSWSWATVRADVDETGLIAGGAPLVRRFIGQPFSNLVAWARKQRGPFVCHELGRKVAS